MLPTQPEEPRRPELRASDADRERIIDVLRQACVDGRLTLDEFGERVGATYAALTLSDLEPLLRDLPVPATSALAVGTVGPPGHPEPQPVTVRQPSRWTVAFMSGSSRKGRWRIRGAHKVVAIMGGCDLDLRGAEVEGKEVVITAFVFMGGIGIVVPEGVAVELEGFVFMGGKDARRIRSAPILPGSPIVRIRAYGAMGGVTVRSKPPLRSERNPEQQLNRGRRDQLDRDRDGYGQPLPEMIGAAAEEDPKAASQLRSAAAPDGTVTILFSDIEGFTALNERVGDRSAQQVLHDHNDLIRSEVTKYAGFEVKNQGDGFMVAFSSASRALRCAIGIQSAFESYNALHPATAVRVRIGMHTGEAIRDEGDFLGGTVNLAARITEQARGGEILASSMLKELCDTMGEFQFGDVQEVELKGLAQPRRIYRVLWRDTEA